MTKRSLRLIFILRMCVFVESLEEEEEPFGVI